MLFHPDVGSAEPLTEEGSGDELRADFAEFESRYVAGKAISGVLMSSPSPLQHLEALVKSTLKGRIIDRRPPGFTNRAPSPLRRRVPF